MGQVSKRIRRLLAKDADNLPTESPERRPGEPLPGGVADMESMTREGYDPIHAAYAFSQQFTSLFAEGVATMPGMEAFAEAIGRAEDEYMPSGPPMSPLTGSYFWTWALYDFRIGRSKDTIASCQIDANDIFGMNPDQLAVVETLANSRMGIYEHVGFRDSHVRLKELLSGDEVICFNPSGYRGTPGELWYVRVLPPLLPEVADYHVALTTPYVLIGSTKNDWIDFLKRSLATVKGSNDRERLYHLMKYGPEPDFWHEFVFKSYHHHQTEAVFLAGIPDLRDTLPHA